MVADWWAEDLSLYTPGPECEAAVSSGKPSKKLELYIMGLPSPPKSIGEYIFSKSVFTISQLFLDKILEYDICWVSGPDPPNIGKFQYII